MLYQKDTINKGLLPFMCKGWAYENNIPRRNSIKIGTETNIFLVGKTSLEGIGNCTAYLYKDKPYYIQLLTNKTTFIFNFYTEKIGW